MRCCKAGPGMEGALAAVAGHACARPTTGAFFALRPPTAGFSPPPTNEPPSAASHASSASAQCTARLEVSGVADLGSASQSSQPPFFDTVAGVLTFLSVLQDERRVFEESMLAFAFMAFHRLSAT